MSPENITAYASARVLIMGALGTLLVKLHEVHILVNDKYTKALEVIAAQARCIATLIGREGDIALAQKAAEDVEASQPKAGK